MQRARPLNMSASPGQPYAPPCSVPDALPGLGRQLRLTAVEHTEVIAAPVRAGTVDRCGPFGRFRW